MSVEQVIVTNRHIRKAGFCASGARKWFENYNLNWNDFLSNGVDAEVLEATGDALAFTVTKIARDEMGEIS